MYGRLAFESITYAMRARELLVADRQIARGGSFNIIRLRQNETPRGCAYGIELAREDLLRAAAILSNARIKFTILQ